MSMARKCALIINPVSGGCSMRKVEQAMAFLKADGFAPELLLTRGADDPAAFARRISAQGETRLIIVGGGDGTVNGVLNGLTPGEMTLAVLPFGTANVLAKELGIRSPEEALRKIARGETRPLSVGLLERDGERRYFFLMAGIGFDGAVVEGVRPREKKVLGAGAYLLTAVRRLLRWERARLEVVAAGVTYDCHSAIVCNAPRYGGDFLLAPGADLFTPGFQVVCVRDGRRSAFLGLALRVILGRGPQGRGVAIFKAGMLDIRGCKALQADGDFCGHAPVRITPVEDFVRVIV